METDLHDGHLNDPGRATLTREPHCVQLRIKGKFTGVSVTTGAVLVITAGPLLFIEYL